MNHDHDLLSILTHYLCRQTFSRRFPPGIKPIALDAGVRFGGSGRQKFTCENLFGEGGS